MSKKSFKNKFFSYYILQFINIYLINKQLIIQNITKIKHQNYLNNYLISNNNDKKTPKYNRLQNNKIYPQIRNPNHNRRKNLLRKSYNQNLNSRNIYK